MNLALHHVRKRQLKRERLFQEDIGNFNREQQKKLGRPHEWKYMYIYIRMFIFIMVVTKFDFFFFNLFLILSASTLSYAKKHE